MKCWNDRIKQSSKELKDMIVIGADRRCDRTQRLVVPLNI